MMKIEAFSDSDTVARGAPKLIPKEAGVAVVTRGSLPMAVSGGKPPWLMHGDLAPVWNLCRDFSGSPIQPSRAAFAAFEQSRWFSEEGPERVWIRSSSNSGLAQ
jgi:hypothetical protein